MSRRLRETLPLLLISVLVAGSVPASTLRVANPGPRFSQGGPSNPLQAKRRTLLQRLLGGDLEAGSYSTGENSLRLREVAKLKFPVLAMDITDRVHSGSTF